MAQLSDDCFAGPAALLKLEDALALFNERLPCVAESIQLPLQECLDCVLAEDLFAPMDVPRQANAAVDGYLVYFDDLAKESETMLPVIGRAAAGHPFVGQVNPGQALRVLTGAVLPEGPDTILMQEDCRLEKDRVYLRPGIKRGANLRKAGEDITHGSHLLRQGQRLRPQDIALAASIGCANLKVRKKLRIALFSTGDELVEVGSPLHAGAIYDSNRTLITLFLRKLGIETVDLGILPDQRDKIRCAIIEATPSVDLIITSGGVSTGDEDYVKTVMADIGKIHFWRLAIKPGRPIALGQINLGSHPIPFVGLPGNPVAVFVNLVHLVRPLILHLMGADPAQNALPRYSAIADFHWKKKPGRREWLRVCAQRDETGTYRLSLFPREGAGILSSLVESDGLAEIIEHTNSIQPGDKIDYLPYWGMW